MKFFFIVLVCLFVSFEASAQVRQKDSHEHGAANLMMVMEEEKLQIEFEVPSESLIGFEHFPKSQSNRENFNEAIKVLSDSSKLFSTPAEAECLLTGLNVSQSLFLARKNMIMKLKKNKVMRIQKKLKFILNSSQTITGIVFI